LAVLGVIVAGGLLIAQRRGIQPTSQQAALLIGLSLGVVAVATTAIALPSQPSAILAILAIGWIIYRASDRVLARRSDLPVGALVAIAVTAAFVVIALAVAAR
jgi:hypothetical protein